MLAIASGFQRPSGLPDSQRRGDRVLSLRAPMEIRFAEPGECDALSDLHRRSSLHWEGDRADLEAHPDALGVVFEAIAERRVRVAVSSSGELAGFSIVTDNGDAVCELNDLFVDPDMFRMGIGRALVQDAAASKTRFGPAVLMRRELGSTEVLEPTSLP